MIEATEEREKTKDSIVCGSKLGETKLEWTWDVMRCHVLLQRRQHEPLKQSYDNRCDVDWTVVVDMMLITYVFV